MRVHYESVTPELPSILRGALLALAALALSFIATSLALTPRAKDAQSRQVAGDVRR